MNPVVDVTWIRVQKPTFDLLGLIVGSLELTGVFALVAAVLGSVLGLSFILRRKLAASRSPGEELSITPGDSLEGSPRPS